MTRAETRSLMFGYFQRIQRGRSNMYRALAILRTLDRRSWEVLRDAHLHGRSFDRKDEARAVDALAHCIELAAVADAAETRVE